jgi:hypothetical protein
MSMEHARVEELSHDSHQHAPAAAESPELEMVDSGHVHPAGVATEGLGRIARLRQRAALKAIEIAPVLGPYLETQAACACSAGCVRCAGPAFGVPVIDGVKSLGRKVFSHKSHEPEQ